MAKLAHYLATKIPHIGILLLCCVFANAYLHRWTDPLKHYVQVLSNVEDGGEKEFLIRMCSSIDSTSRQAFLQRLLDSDDTQAQYYALALESRFANNQNDFDSIKNELMLRMKDPQRYRVQMMPHVDYYGERKTASSIEKLQYKSW